ARRLTGTRHLLGVDGDDDALVAELVGGLGDEIRVVDRRRVDRDLVGPGEQQLADVGDLAHAAADRHRHEAVLGRAGGDDEDALAVVGRGGDVEEAQFVGPGRVIGARGLDRIAGVDQVDEVDPFHDAAVLDVEAWNYAGFQHRLFSS